MDRAEGLAYAQALHDFQNLRLDDNQMPDERDYQADIEDNVEDEDGPPSRKRRCLKKEKGE